MLTKRRGRDNEFPREYELLWNITRRPRKAADARPEKREHVGAPGDAEAAGRQKGLLRRGRRQTLQRPREDCGVPGRGHARLTATVETAALAPQQEGTSQTAAGRGVNERFFPTARL